MECLSLSNFRLFISRILGTKAKAVENVIDTVIEPVIAATIVKSSKEEELASDCTASCDCQEEKNLNLRSVTNNTKTCDISGCICDLSGNPINTNDMEIDL